MSLIFLYHSISDLILGLVIRFLSRSEKLFTHKNVANYSILHFKVRTSNKYLDRYILTLNFHIVQLESWNFDVHFKIHDRFDTDFKFSVNYSHTVGFTYAFKIICLWFQKIIFCNFSLNILWITQQIELDFQETIFSSYF